MRSLFYVCTGFVLFCHSIGWSAPTSIPLDSGLRCEGKTETRQRIQIAMVSSGDGTSSGLVTLGDRQIRFKNLRTLVAHHTNVPTTLQWIADLNSEVFSVQHNGENFKVTWQVPLVPVGSLRAQLVKGEFNTANCTIIGNWGLKIEEVAPPDFQTIKSILSNQPSDETLISTIALVRSSDYSAENKDGFYRQLLSSHNISSGILRALLEAIFSEDSKPDLQLLTLDKINDHDFDFFSTAANSLARCPTCTRLDEKVWLRIYGLARAQIRSGAIGAHDSWKSLANLTFRDKAQGLPLLPDALDLIFSSKALSGAGGPDFRLGDLADLLTIEIPAEELSKTAAPLFDRLLSSPQFSKRATQRLVRGLLSNHAKITRAQPSLPIALQLHAFQKLMMKKSNANDEILRRHHWLLAEEAMQGKSASEISAWAVAGASDYAVVENALAWMAEQKEAVPGGKNVIKEISANIQNINPMFIDFPFEGTQRGVLHDLAMFSFSTQAKKLDLGFTTLVNLLLHQPLSSQLLQKIGMTLYESNVFSDAEATELLSLVVKHPNYIEGSTEALPSGGMISVYLSRSLKQEKKINAPPARFDVMFLGSLLREIVDSRHLDRDDPEIEKAAQMLLKQISTL